MAEALRTSARRLAARIPLVRGRLATPSVSLASHIRSQSGAEGFSERWGSELDQSNVHEGATPTEADFWGEAGATGPWGFISSRYTIALIVMAVLINRIQHLCRPRRRPAALSPGVRLSLRLPSLLLLTYSLVPLVLLTVHEMWPSWTLPSPPYPWSSSSLYAPSAPRSRDTSILWQVFLASCAAVVSSSLVHTLEGGSNVGGLGGIHVGAAGAGGIRPEEAPSFNLVGHAILLHFHSNSKHFPPGPNVLLCILLQTAELWCLEVAGAVSGTPKIPRLSITTLFGLASTAHYVFATGTGGYPFLQSFNRAPDVALIAIILLTAFLHAITMLATEGSIEMRRLLFTEANLPGRHDDYSLALFKLGTACLESTRLSGLARELSSVSTPMGTWLEIGSDGQAHVSPPRSRAAQVQDLQSGALTRVSPAHSSSRSGLNREIRIVRVAREESHSGAGVLAGGARWSAAKDFLLTFVVLIINVVRLASSKVVGVLPFSLPATPPYARDLPRKIRLLWHGTSGEESRQQKQEERRKAKAAIAELNVLRERLARVEEILGTPATDDLARAFERVEHETDQARGNAQVLAKLLSKVQKLRQHADELLRAVGHAPTPQLARSCEVTHAEQVLLNPTPLDCLWEALGAGAGYDEDEDEDWKLDSDDDGGGETTESESEGGGTSKLAMDGLRSARIRRILSPGPEFSASAGFSSAMEDEREDTLALVEAARHNFENEPRGATSSVAGNSESQPFQNVLMAHMSSPTGAGVLTRRRFNQLTGSTSVNLAPQPDEKALRATIERRRRASPAVETDSARTACVICLTEPRTVLLLPCRCVALCNGCREDLSSRPPTRIGNDAAAGFDTDEYRRRGPPTHTCPTCRAPVEAFTRIFVP
ncbi:hypothetical protein IE81DRAFT_347793 [Ceraceosorus guamensis]|uniref:RING-type domain-containing protein n=1 Tax=Ceraceosorus guamensis TaxID=1522189 RepID=A0A316VX82_9BASI|nr:hypothetical protein IE81DRAFT_347793 [Ceraceosorus guamensis]PWN42070.1 hypothetical protein IE81DRAFT_347793 [Ceraceosorus guamensis]